MRAVFRLDRIAVSPVIATILMVAITVVLAGVLYIMLSGILRPVDREPEVMGVHITKTGDGKNWSLLIVTTPTGLMPSEAKLTIIAPNGGTTVAKTFSALSYGADGAAFVGSGTVIADGDRVLVDSLRYPVGYQVLISDVNTILYSATFA